MDNIIQGISEFQDKVFPGQQAMYQRLVRDGQQPKALIIACADSRVSPEHITQAGPGELFVCRNAGNIVPPFSTATGGVSSAIEYAVVALGVRDVVVCGHSDCGAMKGLMSPEALARMPNVAAWLRHSHAAERIVCEAYPADMDPKERHRALALENVIVQLANLRTHPSVAAGLAKGQLRLHGWFFEIETGILLAYDGEAGRFLPLDALDSAGDFPVAQGSAVRMAAPEYAPPQAAA
ncbi:carbonic anhydrase [Methylobacterium sp. E-041]|uniref:carbonic anhydrase n=1 Tax=unclassified Methylobacterium TaxID=2615210 RepID=UPI0011C914E5|nr:MULTISPECIES: carbonic anhydrase [unclassified Methylobacterium]MCJ2105351.1 carbonic anhydrase [Methylobacterium sp. E-041]MCJ2112445.1 carbonic anhydrase [Methylobacterium sp. E-025]TXM83130.1 carbonic anhydrase [Methylobacterium sp. WL116]TXN36669.1 carbonic anhydrase [Methylobacterium sp. WL93]TXN49273.1 carbonic anhydrase [Methylobacterium sp. WL119]